MPAYYPDNVRGLWKCPKHSGVPEDASATGTGVSVECGVSVKLWLTIGDGAVREARFATNGCGWAVAAAESISGLLEGAVLTDLRGLEMLGPRLADDLGAIPEVRRKCVAAAMEAAAKALAAYRERAVEEWAGEKALICSCFGVSEDLIEDAAESGTVRTVADVGELFGAGSGCGSCQMLIREILEAGNG